MHLWLLLIAQLAVVTNAEELSEKPGNVVTHSFLHSATTPADTRSRAIVQNRKEAFRFPELGVVLRSDFDGGRATEAKQVDESTLQVYIAPENEPINWSPWYSFAIEPIPSEAAQPLVIEFAYPPKPAGSRPSHRYWPKLSKDGGKTWSPADPEFYDHASARITIEPSWLPLLISAQEVMTSAESIDWMSKVSRAPFASYEEIGRSTYGKPIHMLHLEEGDDENKKEVFVLSRQHPPEVTGYLAMQHFVEYLASDEPDAVAFRKYANIRVAPMLNPDGVDDGHWRHNAGGVDLNRDWREPSPDGEAGQFHQPETRAASKAFLRYQESEVLFAIDFHSTYRNVFYHDAEPGTGEYTLLHNWIFRIGRALPQSKLEVQGSAANGSSTSKSWFRRQFGCPAVTYEVDDATDRDELKRIAIEAAKSLIAGVMPRP